MYLKNCGTLHWLSNVNCLECWGPVHNHNLLFKRSKQEKDGLPVPGEDPSTHRARKAKPANTEQEQVFLGIQQMPHITKSSLNKI
jgi:hypothetical protein